MREKKFRQIEPNDFKSGQPQEDLDDVLAEGEREGQGRGKDSLKPEGQETFRESAKTVGELLDLWRQQYEETDDKGIKPELAYKIIRMRMALGVAKLDANEVKIRESETGVLGLYDPATGEVAITEEGLELPAEHFADVLVHESGHAGKLTGKRLMDEGVAESVTLSKLPGAMQGIYQRERRLTKETFSGVGAEKALRAYDFDHPTRLAEMYLEVELRDQWKKIKEKLPDERPETSAAQDKALRKAMVGVGKSIKDQFKKGVPDLYEKLREENFDFKGNELKILRRLYKD